MSQGEQRRASWIGAPEMFNLTAACQLIADAYGLCVYLVGSALDRRDHRDVDVRCMLDDAEFDRLFPGPMAATSAWLDARNALLSAAISEWLRARTGLKIDFQFQRQSNANASFPGPRIPLGVTVLRPREEHFP
jgi:hypothetical protein